MEVFVGKYYTGLVDTYHQRNIRETTLRVKHSKGDHLFSTDSSGQMAEPVKILFSLTTFNGRPKLSAKLREVGGQALIPHGYADSKVDMDFDIFQSINLGNGECFPISVVCEHKNSAKDEENDWTIFKDQLPAGFPELFYCSHLVFTGTVNLYITLSKI